MQVELQGTQGGYFIDYESALGVMTGWCTLLEYQAAGFSSRMRRVFIEQCLWQGSPFRDIPAGIPRFWGLPDRLGS
jgi:hypothetical protein